MIKNILKKILPPHYIEILKKFRNKFPIIAQRQNKFSKIYSFIHKYTLTKYKINKFYNRNIRNLEIGPGDYRLNNFLTINIVKNRVTDCVVDINKRLPFKDNTFHTIYASHIVEHIFWYKLDKLFSELYRVTAPSGCVEIWVPDGLKIAKAFVDAELKKIPTGCKMVGSDLMMLEIVALGLMEEFFHTGMALVIDIIIIYIFLASLSVI